MLNKSPLQAPAAGLEQSIYDRKRTYKLTSNVKAPKQERVIVIGLRSRLTQRAFGADSKKYNEFDRATIPSRIKFHLSGNNSSLAI